MTLPIQPVYTPETIPFETPIYTDENGNLVPFYANGFWLADGTITANPSALT